MLIISEHQFIWNTLFMIFWTGLVFVCGFRQFMFMLWTQFIWDTLYMIFWTGLVLVCGFRSRLFTKVVAFTSEFTAPLLSSPSHISSQIFSYLFLCGFLHFCLKTTEDHWWEYQIKLNWLKTKYSSELKTPQSVIKMVLMWFSIFQEFVLTGLYR